jgi:hypothetical protein
VNSCTTEKNGIVVRYRSLILRTRTQRLIISQKTVQYSGLVSSADVPVSTLESPRNLSRFTTQQVRPTTPQDQSSRTGSGYSIMATRFPRTGIRVMRKLHFNALGEGKRSETDGRNTDIHITSRRESAMRACDAAACVIP